MLCKFSYLDLFFYGYTAPWMNENLYRHTVSMESVQPFSEVCKVY